MFTEASNTSEFFHTDFWESSKLGLLACNRVRLHRAIAKTSAIADIAKNIVLAMSAKKFLHC